MLLKELVESAVNEKCNTVALFFELNLQKFLSVLNLKFNYMKNLAISLFIICLSYAGTSFAQVNNSLTGKSGIYLTAADFSAGKLMYEINCSAEKLKIKTSDFLNSKTVVIIHNDSTIKLPKLKIWGFRLCDEKEYRINDNKEYEIMDKNSITVYKFTESQTLTGKNKHTTTKTTYYFSESAESPLQVLTLKNVETSFASNKKFHDLIDLYFKSDEDLLIFDDYYKMLRLNHIYQESLK